MLLHLNSEQISNNIKSSKRILYIVYGLSVALCFFNLAVYHAMHGEYWIQADWLINSTEVFVRRGTLGYILIRISDILHLELITLIIFVQANIALITILLTLDTAIKIGCSPRLLFLLISPGFFVVFWAINHLGMLRKEALIFLAFAILAHGAALNRLSTVRSLLSMSIYICAVIAHEGMVFFIFHYIVALYLCHNGSKKKFLILIASLLIFSCAAVLINIIPPPLSHVTPVCRPLLERGFSSYFCTGAIEALTKSADQEFIKTSNFRNGISFFTFSYAYGLSLLPLFLYFYNGRQTNIRLLCLFIIGGVAFIPLFYIAVDWGRWIVFHVSATTFLLLILKARGFPLEPETQYPQKLSYFFVSLLLLFEFDFSQLFLKPGFIATLILYILWLLSSLLSLL